MRKFRSILIASLAFALWQISSSFVWSAWTIETVDWIGRVGTGSSIALDSGDHPHISYRYYTTSVLKYAYKDASGWHTETADNLPDVGSHTSIAVDSSDYPHISYCYYTTSALKYAWKDASGWHTETVPGTGKIEGPSSIAVNSSGYPHISYRDDIDDLKYAYKDASGWHTETVDNTSGIASITLDSSGNPHLGYAHWIPYGPGPDEEDVDLKYAYKDTSGWHTETVDDPADYPTDTTKTGYSSSIALDSLGNPHIAYLDSLYSPYIRYARWTGSSWHIETVTNAGFIGGDVSLALDSFDHPHISYGWDYMGEYIKHLNYAHWNGSSWDIETVDDGENVGWYSSIALDSFDHPHISYHDSYPNEDLKYARWILKLVAAIDLVPDTLNLKSKGKWISCYIELPGRYSVEEIDLVTVVLQHGNYSTSIAPKSPSNVGDYDEDTIPDLMVKFDRKDLIDYLTTLNPLPESVTLTVSGNAGELSFEGEDAIRVISKSDALGAELTTPTEPELYQNYPNPFNPETTIEYDLEKDCHVTLKIYNMAGQLIKTLVDEYQTAGHYAITWYGDTDGGGEVASGVYFYRIKAEDFVSTKKMVVLK